jgi:hypothetical protein
MVWKKILFYFVGDESLSEWLITQKKNSIFEHFYVGG